MLARITVTLNTPPGERRKVETQAQVVEGWMRRQGLAQNVTVGPGPNHRKILIVKGDFVHIEGKTLELLDSLYRLPGVSALTLATR